MIKKRISLFLLLLLPIFVYNITQVSRVHLMKFTGDFSIAYQDIKLLSNDFSFGQTLLFNVPSFLTNYYHIDNYQYLNNNSYYSDISYLHSFSRAPPIIL